MIMEKELLAEYPAEVPVDPREVAASVAATGRVLVVLDDDPTGTQSVSDLPVLTRWDVEDFAWALGTGAPAVYVLTNTRSLDPAEAQARNREAVDHALTAAREAGVPLGFVSRSDSTLRGHFPLEPDAIAATLAERTGEPTDGVVVVPAFPEAGRITVGGVHYTRDGQGGLVPVAETEFARDATFHYSSSHLARYVEEKSGGRWPAEDVIVLDLHAVRGGAAGIADLLEPAAGSTPVVVDVVTENDLRALALGLAEAERRGKKLLYRVGPPFVRARIGQEQRAPLTGDEVPAGGTGPVGGLVVVGSHVGVTTRQLKALTDRHSHATTVELPVEAVLDPDRAEAQLTETVGAVVAALAEGDVVLHTSRLLVRSEDPSESLRIARTVSAAVVAVVNRTLRTAPPRFVVAKGGITSSDVAAHGLEIRHAMVRGPMLPGIVSLWEPVDGPARGIPYVVFAGNVGDDGSLAEVVRKLSTTF
ncbi:four-carbon acid sugar kinase family protein [Kocuria sp. M1R5S2]|uniref:four-carbon acid sugar kinase family protein n=1 Tax=Kocuria rhizosphaerae TaxID=3376285 RepID=UPI0037A911AA